MGAAEKLELISESEYLAFELVSEQKHEYLSGGVYAMAGATNRHNRIVMNCAGSLHASLKGKPCSPFNSDTKVRIRQITGTRFYYPDVMIVCDPNPEEDSFQDSPSVIIEVISESTRRIDEGEKKDSYLTIPGLSTYLLVEQDLAKVVAYRRTEKGFDPEIFQGLESTVPLPEVEAELALAEVYDEIEFDG